MSPNTYSSSSTTIQIPGTHGSRREIPCSLDKFENNRLLLSTTERVSTATLISVKRDDALLLGEVVTCSPANEASWKLEVRVEQILSGLQSLVALRARLLGEGLPSVPHLPVAR